MARPYTPDSHFEALQDKDISVEFIGFVDEIFAPTIVGRTKKFLLFKFILSNGSKRITCLVWGKELISQFEELIKINAIIHIDGATCKAVMGNFYKDSQNLVAFELIIKDNTLITNLGMHQPQTLQCTPTDVDFESIVGVSGPIRIKGFIKTVITQCHSKNENMTFGCGAITDGTYKISIQVAKFDDNHPIEKGQNVTVTGTVRSDDGPPMIICKDMGCIVPNTIVAKMPIEELFNGVRTPKRKIMEA